MTEEPKPAPRSTGLAVLKGITVGLGVLLVLGMIGIVFVIAGGGASDGDGARYAEGPLVLPRGAAVEEMDLDGPRASFLVRQADGTRRLIIRDLTTGEQTSVAVVSPD